MLRLRFSMFLALVFAAHLAFAQAGVSISLTVDATKTPQKMLYAHEVLPVQPGPLTLYYPKWIPGDHAPSGPIAASPASSLKATAKSSPGDATCLTPSPFILKSPPA